MLKNLDNKPTIAALLNVFKRGPSFERQLRAIQNQTISPEQIFVWKNAGDSIPDHLKTEITIAECNENLGVWARFAYALNIDAEYICVFDDDTIPGAKWFENCIDTIQIHNGLLGTRGLRFTSRRSYNPTVGYGWSAPNEEVVQVDIVGHAWFFRREWLSAFWAELPGIGFDKLAGEDIHFSYAIQKHLGLNTYVPIHPKNNPELWGSSAYYGQYLGLQPDAIALRPDAAERFNKVYKKYLAKGFKLCELSEHSKKSIVLGTGLVENTRLRNKLKKFPIIFNCARKFVNWLSKLGIHV